MGVPGLFANLHQKYKHNIIKRMVPPNGIIENSSKYNNINDCLKRTNEHPLQGCASVPRANEHIGISPQLNQQLFNIKTDILYFDFNCLIHPVCHLLWSEYKDKNISTSDFENKVINKTLEYMHKVIEYVNPSICGIYIDGVCPVSKMAQQRQRRFASILDKEVMNNIRGKNGIAREEYYDTNAITPGTKFMETLSDAINQYIETHRAIKFVYSSYMEHGEGEHKIINHIKANKDEFRDKNIVIYGLDADLIILGLTLISEFKIMLLREETNVSFDTFNMVFFDVGACAECIINELTTDKDSIIDNQFVNINNKLNVIDDFIFITIILGNDFIPANPTLNMRFRNKGTYGYDILMDTYKSLLFDNKIDQQFTYIVTWSNKKLIINWHMFVELINRLATYEEQYFENARIYHNNKTNAKNKAEEQIYHFENLMFSHPDALTMHNKYIDYETVRKPRFIHHYFGSNVAKCSQININGQSKSKPKLFNSQLLDKNSVLKNGFYNDKKIVINQNEYDIVICDYLKTFSYVMYYYYNGCPDNLYYYKHANSVLLSDLYEYCSKNKNILNNIMDTYYGPPKHTLIHPMEQLLMVLPNKSFNLLPKSIEKFLNSTDHNNYLLTQYKHIYFPNTIKRDFINKSRLFQAALILEIPSLNIIRSLIRDKKITISEAKRCLIHY